MGCDIHVVLEKKFGEKWIGIEELHSRYVYEFDYETKKFSGPKYERCRARERNYDLFAAIAGVRGEGPPAKGLPPDASELSRAVLAEDDPDLHSHSYCSIGEYIEKLLASVSEPGQVFLTDGHPAVANPYQFWFGMYAPEEGEEFRVVFAFDN